MSNSLNVYLNDEYIGNLNKDGNGGIIFQYAKNVSRCLSLSLPVNKETYNNKSCRGFFNGLLPESENTRISLGKKYGINYKNDFSLLQAIGYDCAGAVSFFDKAPENIKEFYNIEYNSLTDDELENYIKELPVKPLGTSKNMRLSLAGAQDKTAVVIDNNKIGLPLNNTPTTHIIKPTLPNFKETIENEFICLSAAKKLGINVPEIKIKYANKTKYFIIERYDREIKNGKIKRIHQEDFCQASNIISAYKYQAEGGVDFKQCFEILRKTSKPAICIKQFIELIIFNYLIGNNDAHGKNFSLLHYSNDNIILAPCYDILCSLVYPDLSNKMAMKIGGYYEHNKIMQRHFEKLANDINVNYTQMKKIMKNQCEILPDIINEIINSFENSIGKEILNIVIKNCKRLSN